MLTSSGGLGRSPMTPGSEERSGAGAGAGAGAGSMPRTHAWMSSSNLSPSARPPTASTDVSSVDDASIASELWAHRVDLPTASPRLLTPLDGKPRTAEKGGGKAPFKPTRELPSYVLHFVDSDGNLKDDIDLEAHRERAVAPVTNAVVQELSDLIPHMTALNMSGCVEVTDVGLWALARTCTGLKDLRMSRMDQISHVGLRSIALRCRDIETLDLSHCLLVNDLCIRVVASGLWSLETIDFSGLPITDGAVSELASCCKKLTSINFSDMKHVGDHGLRELAANCSNITKLDLRNVVYVKGPGLETLIKGAPNLKYLDVGGNYNLPKPVFTALSHCPLMTYLNIENCVKLDTKTLTEMVRNMPHLTELNVSNCKLLKEKAMKVIGNRCHKLSVLKMANLPHFKTDAAIALARGCPNLDSLDLSGCEKLSEDAVKALVIGMSRLTNLRLNKCERVTRPFIRSLARELPYVTTSKDFFGLTGLPDSKERIKKTEQRRGQVRAVTDLQRTMRGFLARKRVRAIRRWILENQSALQISRVWRGYWARRRVKAIIRELTREEAAMKIQTVLRGFFGRMKAAKARWRRDLLRRQIKSATLIQSAYRAWLGRQEYDRLLAEKFLEEQEERRLGEKKRRCVRMVEGAWQMYLARREVERLREILRQKALLLMRQIKGAMQMQRLFRGHMARSLRRKLEQNMWDMIRQGRAALIMQCCARQFLSKLEAGRRRAERERLRRLKAATDIQRVWRGSRGRHLYALLLSLKALRAVEEAAATRIQTKYRCYRSRQFLLLLKRLQAEALFREKMATQIQKAYRGLKGRQVAEIAKNVKDMRAISAPLQDDIATLEIEELATRRAHNETERRIKLTEERILSWEDERTKLLSWGKKFYDSDKLTGTSQRYETKFLRDALIGQMHAFHQTLEQLNEQLVETTYRLHDVNRRLRGKRRDLVPIERGIVTRTLQARKQRIADRKILEAKSVSIIAGLYRGWKVRKLCRLGLLPEPELVDSDAEAEVEAALEEYGSATAKADEEAQRAEQEAMTPFDGVAFDYDYDYWHGPGEEPVPEPRDIYADQLARHKTRNQIMAMGPEYGEDAKGLRDAMLDDEGHPESPYKPLPEIEDDPDLVDVNVKAKSTCVERDPETGDPIDHVPKLLRGKLDRIDNEAFPYRERRQQIKYLRQNVKEKQWMLVSGLADQIIVTQTRIRDKKEKLRTKKAKQEKARKARNDNLRLDFERSGMAFADRESTKFEKDVAIMQRKEALRKRKEFEVWMANQRQEMETEDYWSFRVEKVHRAWVQEKARARFIANERVRCRAERERIVQMASESGAVNAVWRQEYRDLAALNARVSKMELRLMADADDESQAANVVWRRVFNAQKTFEAAEAKKKLEEKEKRKALRKAKRAVDKKEKKIREEREAAGLPPEFEDQWEVDTDDEHEDSEDEADMLLLPPPVDVEQYYEGELERGNDGWISLMDDEGYVYYHNEITGQTTWDTPEDF